MWYALLYLAMSGLLIWWMVRFYRSNPQAFSKENISKSFTTIGLLALLIIGIIYLAVKFLTMH